MKKRSLGLTVLAFSSVIVGLYSQIAAIALILVGSVFTVAGSVHAGAALVLGAVYLGVTGAAYFVGFGFWTTRHWAWAGGMILFGALIVVSVALVLLTTNLLASFGPLIGSAVAIWYLRRPATKAELLGTEAAPADETETQTTSDTLESPQPAR